MSYKKQKLILLVCLVLIPSVLIVAYYSSIASDRYESISEISVKKIDGGGAADVLQGIPLLSPVGTTNNEDKLFLLSYIRSMDMVNLLEEKLKISELYSREGIDFLNKLEKNPSREQLLNHYRKYVDVFIDDSTSLLNIKVQAFTKEDAYMINKLIVETSERFINELSRKTARDQMAFTENQADEAFQEYASIKNKILRFQNKNNLLNPEQKAMALENLASTLDSTLSAKEIELRNRRNYMSDSSYQIKALKSEIESIKKQIEKEHKRIAASESDGKQLNEVAAAYEELMMRFNFAQEKYKIALMSLETIKVDVNKKFKTISVIQSPTMPDQAMYPKRINSAISKIALLLILYGISRLILAIIEDNRG